MRGCPRLWLLVAVVSLAGCATLAPPEERNGGGAGDAGGDAPETESDAAGQARGDDSDAGGQAAVQGLLDQARAASADGDHGRAGSLLERALGIRPEHAVLWHNLAIVRYRQEAFAEAAELARRSLSHEDGQPGLAQRNWQLIAASLEQTGDSDGAAEARRRAEGIREAGQND